MEKSCNLTHKLDHLTSPIGQDERGVVALKSLILKASAGALRKSSWCDDNRSSCRDNDEERLERLGIICPQSGREKSDSVCPTFQNMRQNAVAEWGGVVWGWAVTAFVMFRVAFNGR